MKKRILSAIMLLAGWSYSVAQTPSLQWEVNYGGTGNDQATSVRQTPDGGYIVAGYTNSDNGDVTGHKSGDDYWVLKTNGDGSIAWKKIYGGNNDDRCYDVRTTSDGGFILAGTSNSNDGDISSPKGGFDAWIVKLDSDGNIEFEKSYGGSDDEAAYSIIQTASGNYLFAGESKSDNIAGNNNKGGYDVYVVHMNQSGNALFQKLYGGSATDRARSVSQLSGGQFIVAGETDSNNGNVSGNKGGFDYYILRLKNNGSLNFTRTIGGTSNDFAYGVVGTNNNGYAVIGETESNNVDVPDNAGGTDFFVVSVKGNGTFRFAKTYGGETHDNGRSIHKTSDGGFILSGETESNDGDVTGHKGSDDFWLVKISAGGSLQWQKTLGGFDSDQAKSAVPTSDGGYVTVGPSESDDGDVSDNNGNADYWIVKLSNPQRQVEAEGNEVRLSLYPNPAVSSATLQGLPEGATVYLLSVHGTTLMEQPVHDASISLDLSSYVPGMYLLLVRFADGGSETIRLIKSN